MADITTRNNGDVEDGGKVNWRGDQVAVPQGGQSIYKSSSIQLAELGSRKVVGDRVFRYAKAKDTIAAGLIASQTNHDAKWLKTTIGTDWVVGARIVALYASTNIAANQFNEGYLWVAQGTDANEGYMYRVKSHSTTSATGDYEVTLYDAIVQTADVSDKCSILPNQYYDCIRNTDETTPPIGVAPIAVTTGDYFWLQTWGPTAVQVGSAGVPATGEEVTVGSAGMSETTGGEFGIGVALNTGSALDSQLVFLKIAP
jgi:hypothetical protein